MVRGGVSRSELGINSLAHNFMMSYLYRLATKKPIETYEHAEYIAGAAYAGYDYLKKHNKMPFSYSYARKRARYGTRSGRRLVLVSPPRLKRARVATPMRTPRRGRGSRGRSRRPGGKFSKAVLGRPIGTADCKTTLVDGSLAIASRTLYGFNIIQIPQVQITSTTGTGSHPSISARERAVVDLRGIKLDIEYRNNINTPLQVNVALIVPRQQNNYAASDWFTDPAGTTERYIGFSTALSSMQLNTYNICSDHYTIFMHKRFTLGGNANYAVSGTYQTQKASFQTMRRYIPIKRQITFFNDDAVDSDNPVFLVHWCDQPFNAAGANAETNRITANYLVRLYWREPKN